VSNFSVGLISLAAPTLFVVALATAGCSRPAEDKAQTVDFYRTHVDERRSVVAACANDPGRLDKTPACVNAQQAEYLEGIGSIKNLPPMGLGHDQAPSK
jgi:hypothetical protein